MSRVSLAPADVRARLQIASDLADLRPERRLDSKLDMSPAGVRRRLQLASELSELCLALGRAGTEAGRRADEQDG